MDTKLTTMLLKKYNHKKNYKKTHKLKRAVNDFFLSKCLTLSAEVSKMDSSKKMGQINLKIQQVKG